MIVTVKDLVKALSDMDIDQDSEVTIRIDDKSFILKGFLLNELELLI